MAEGSTAQGVGLHSSCTGQVQLGDMLTVGEGWVGQESSVPSADTTHREAVAPRSMLYSWLSELLHLVVGP
jgi:hypothetical protein